MIKLEQHQHFVVLPIKATPGARKTELRGIHDGQLRVAVTQIAEKGKANKAIIALLAKGLKLRKSQIELLSGETSTQKKFAVTDISLLDLKDRISAIV